MQRAIVFLVSCFLYLQVSAQSNGFTVVKNNVATPVKNQYSSGTCWCFSATAMTESEMLQKGKPELDLSETFTVWNLYIDKAIKYMRRRGDTRFAEGGLGQDMLNAAANFGAMPQSVYPGEGKDTIMSRNYKMADQLKAYLDGVLSANKDTIPTNWKDGFMKILNSYLGQPPAEFDYNGKHYTPQTFAAEFITEKPSDFIGLTSFTHHPYYTSFVMEVPDNYNSNAYYNLPLAEFIQTVKDCIAKGYTLTWDADVSNKGFQTRKGLAMWVSNDADAKALPDFNEQPYNATIRQELFDKQVTQDDHLMQITGLAKDAAGKEYFIVKNSYGLRGPFAGYVYVSMPYFAINTISVLVNKKAVPAGVVK
jgi:bleomycin hydrolase